MSSNLNESNTSIQVGDEFTELTGGVLEGRYQILERVGSGATGEVFRALHQSIDTQVAVKVMHGSLIHDAAAVTRFLNESKAASKLTHKGIVQIFSTGSLPDGRPYIAMEYVGDGSLRWLMDERKVLSPELTVGLLSQACEALQHAHNEGILHRDLKPANVLLSKVEHGYGVKITDFGLAKVFQSELSQTLTSTGSIVGSPAYMSPEQCRGGAVDSRSDVYSLGCVAFECLTGRVPFQSESVYEVLFQHLNEEVPLFADIPGAVRNEALETVVARAMSKEPADRFADMNEFGLALRQALEGRAVAVKSGPRRRKSKRQKLLLRWGAILLGLSLISYVWALQWRPVKDERTVGSAGTSATVFGKQLADEGKTEAAKQAFRSALLREYLKVRADEKHRDRALVSGLINTMNEATRIAPDEDLLGHDLSGEVMSWLGHIYRDESFVDEPLEKCYMQVAWWHGDLSSHYRAWRDVAEHRYRRKDLDAATAQFAALRAHALERNYPYHAALADAYLARIASIKGDNKAASAHLSEFVSLSRKAESIPSTDQGSVSPRERSNLFKACRDMAALSEVVEPQVAEDLYTLLLDHVWVGPQEAPQTYTYLADYYFRKGQLDKADTLAQKAISARPDGVRVMWLACVDAYRLRAEIALKRKNSKQALEHLAAGSELIRSLNEEWNHKGKLRRLARRCWKYSQLYSRLGRTQVASELTKIEHSCDPSGEARARTNKVFEDDWTYVK